MGRTWSRLWAELAASGGRAYLLALLASLAALGVSLALVPLDADDSVAASLYSDENSIAPKTICSTTGMRMAASIRAAPRR